MAGPLTPGSATSLSAAPAWTPLLPPVRSEKWSASSSGALTVRSPSATAYRYRMRVPAAPASTLGAAGELLVPVDTAMGPMEAPGSTLR